MISLDQELIAYTRMAIDRAEVGVSCESMAYVALRAACLFYRKYKCEFAELLINMTHTAKLSMANMTPHLPHSLSIKYTTANACNVKTILHQWRW